MTSQIQVSLRVVTIGDANLAGNSSSKVGFFYQRMKNAISANNTTKAILSVPEAADYLTVSTRTLRTWVAERKIRVARLGGRVVLRLVDVDRFVEKRLEGGVL